MKRNIPLFLIFLVVFVDLLGFGILIPILPTFATKELQVSESYVGIVIAIYSLVQFLFNPIFGSLSDRYGRRKIILYTLFLNALGYVIFSFSHTFWMLLLSRVVSGIGGSSIGVAQAYIADVTTREERSKGMGLIGVAFGLGFVFGPLMGGLLSHYGYEVTGFASAAFSILALLLSIFALPESLTPENRNVENRRKILDVQSFRVAFGNVPLAVLMIMFFVITFSVANIYGTFALMGHKIYHFTDMDNGYIFAIVGLVSAAVQGGLVGKLSKKYSDTTLVTSGALFMMLGLLFLPYGQNFIGVAIITFILSIGTGILQPVLLSLVSKVAPENLQGTTLGVNQSLSAFARMLGPLWGGFAFQYLGYQIPFLTGAFFTFFIFLFSVFFLKRHLK